MSKIKSPAATVANAPVRPLSEEDRLDAEARAAAKAALANRVRHYAVIRGEVDDGKIVWSFDAGQIGALIASGAAEAATPEQVEAAAPLFTQLPEA